jgi:1-acyl-sn-glycerol-3-phosphate acyltransferase
LQPVSHSATYAAAILVAVLAAALVGWIVVARRRTNYTLTQSFLYTVNLFFARVMWRTQVSGPLPVADHEGAVIICNHTSGVDPCVIQLCTHRVVHWMVAREYYSMFGLAWAFRAVEAIAVNRGGIDTAATKNAIRLAEQGGLVGLFPEGRVNTTEALLQPGRPGAALIALRARVKVIPIFVTGVPYNGTALGSLFMTGNARVKVGQPIDLSEYYGRENDRAVLEEITKKFLIEMARLAGVNDFEPKLAGKNWKLGDNGDDEIEPATPETVTAATKPLDE